MNETHILMITPDGCEAGDSELLAFRSKADAVAWIRNHIVKEFESDGRMSRIVRNLMNNVISNMESSMAEDGCWRDTKLTVYTYKEAKDGCSDIHEH